jgi:precorrin-2/cobalt-factor-2 C20-methyltransferase
VGPGDPGLITLRAAEVLGSVDVVFAAGSPKNKYSVALNVVRELLPPETSVHRLDFPMTSDREELQAAWRRNAVRVLAELEAGREAAFVTIGDPLTYSTYAYLIKTLRSLAPDVTVETVPGVTAYHAAAARLNLPLVESHQSLIVASGVSSPEEIARLAACGDTVVIMKPYKNYDRILDAVEALNDGRRAYTVTACGLADEKVAQEAGELRGQRVPYLSLMIVKAEDGER